MSVDADIPASTDLLGKSVTDLQEDVIISGGVISGTSKYVTGYTGFSGDPALQSGNFIAFHAEQDGAASISVRKIGSENDPVTLDEDGIVVMRVERGDKGFDLITVADGVTFVNRFTFNLILESEE